MVENADGYEIQYSTDKKKWTKLATTTALTYTHKKLTYNKAYYYKVRSYKKVDGTTVYSNFSATVNAKPLSQAPTVTVTQLDNGSVKLTYKSDSSATLYKIYKKTNSEEAYTLLTSTSNITYTVKNLTLGETTSFKVVAYKAKVMGGETIVDHNVTISTPTLKLNGDTLSWSSIKDAESYSLYQCSDTCTLLVDTPQLTYTSSLINNDKTYYYYVVATNSSFVSAKSAYVTNVEAFTDSKVIMNYSTNTNAATFVITSKTKFDGYALYMSTSKKGTYTKVASTSSLGVGAMINYTKATYNKTLYYKVRPYVVIDGKTVYGAYSDVVTFKNTLNNIPLKFTNVSNTSIKIDWDKITSATKYELYYSINGAKYKKVDLTTNTYTHKNLKYGDKINYYVRAVLKIAGKTYYGDSKTNPYAVDVESPKVDYTVTNLLNGSVKITTKTSGSYYVIVDNETITFTGTTCVLNGLTPNETYEFIVGEYVNGTYGQGNGKEVYVFDRIDAPTLDVRYDSSTSATIMWDDLGTNITYKIYLEGNKIYEGTNTVLSQYNLIPGKAYEYEIEVTYDDGNKTVTSERKSSIVRTLPDVINDFTVTVNGNLNAMTVTAEPISTATYYYLLYRNSTKEEYKILAGHNEPNFVNVKVTAGKTYYLMVASAADYNGKLFYSEKGTEKIVKTLPAQVTGITATSPSYNSNKITWTKISGTTGYEIYYSTNNKTWKKITSTTSNSYTHKSLTTGTTYYYKVRTYKTVSKKNYYGDYSMVVNTKPLPASPTGLKVVRYNYSSKMNTVSWAKVTGASGYTLYSSIDGGNTYKTVASTTKLTYTDKKASANGTYYKVRAYRTVSGKKVYGAYSKEIYMRAPLEPNYSVYISSNYYSGSTATPMIITNNGNYSIKILSKGAFLLDRDYASFDRTMKLINTDTFKNISSTTCAAGEDCLIAFKYSSTWVDQYTRYYFDFIYDGVKYQAKSSYYYQNTYTKYSEKSES